MNQNIGRALAILLGMGSTPPSMALMNAADPNLRQPVQSRGQRKPTNAAAFKRAAKKRKNIRARSAK